MKNLYKIFFVAALIAGLCACGRYSEPSPIEGSGYPHSYPQH